MRPLNRVEPRGPAAAYQTYVIDAPMATHRRRATCAEVDCAARAHGWASRINIRTDLGAAQAVYIRMHSGRAFTATEPSADGIVTFTFPAGQNCFAEHTVSLERPEFFSVHGGDFRGNPFGSVRRHTRAADWVDDFANHQDRLATRAQRG